MADPVPYTRAGFWRGVAVAHPMVAGVFVYGIAFGLMAEQARLAPWQAVLVSAFVFSGSAQVAAMGLLAAGISTLSATLWAVIALVLVINARYFLFSATLYPWIKGLPARQIYPTLFTLGDGSWMLSMRAYDQGERDAGFLLGSGLGSGLSWVLGTAVGSVIGGYAPDPRALALDFLLAAFAVAMLVGMIRRKSDGMILGVAIVIAIGFAKIGQANWAPVAAGLGAGLLACLRYQEARPDGE